MGGLGAGRIRAVAGAATVVFFVGLVAVSSHSVFGPSSGGGQAVSAGGGTGAVLGSALGAPGPPTSSASVGGPSSAASPGGGGAVAGIGGGAGGSGLSSGTPALGGAGLSGPSGSTGPAAPGSATGPLGQGVTATEIRVGFWTTEVASGCKSLGATGGAAATGCQDETPLIKAVAAYVNAHGGIAHRKFVPVIYQSEGTSSTFDAQAQAACTNLAEDNKVFVAASSFVAGRQLFSTCMARHGIPVLDPGYWPFDQAFYDSLNGLLFQPSRARPERWLAAYVDGLAAQGFFTPGARVGLFRFDDPVFAHLTETVLKPRLAAHGVTLVDQYAVSAAQDSAGLSDMAAQLNSGIVRFRSEAIDHVIFFDLGSELSFFYFPEAEAQGYRPHYGLNSYQAFELLAENAPKAQFAGAIGVGWTPGADVPPAHDPGGNPQAVTCQKAFVAAGLAGGSGRSVLCDEAFLVTTALDATTDLTVNGLRAAIEGLGTSFLAPTAFATDLGPRHHDGAVALRYVKFDGGCGCFAYVGGLHPF